MPPKSANDQATNQLLSAIIRELGSISSFTGDNWENVGKQILDKDATPITGHAARQRFGRLIKRWKKDGITGDATEDDDQVPVTKAPKPKKAKVATTNKVTKDADDSEIDADVPVTPPTTPAITTTKSGPRRLRKAAKKPELVVDESEAANDEQKEEKVEKVEKTGKNGPMTRSRSASEDIVEEEKSVAGEENGTKVNLSKEEKNLPSKGKETAKRSRSNSQSDERSGENSEATTRKRRGRPPKKSTKAATVEKEEINSENSEEDQREAEV